MYQALLAIILIATGLFSPQNAVAQALLPVPPLTARVIDETGTLTAADRQLLDTKLAAIELRNGSQVVVLMVPTTRPEDIAAYANRVANAWKIGRRDVGDGVIVLVAQQDRKMRIEVAKTLEGALPDIAAARIIDDAMKPRFQQNNFVGGLAVAIDQIGARIAGEALPVPAGKSPRATGGSGFDWTDLAVFLFFGVMVAGPVARRIFGQRLGGLIMGGGAGGLALLVTSSLLIAGGVGVLALLYTWLFGGRGGRVWDGGGRAGVAGAAGGLGGWAGGAGSGGWGGGMGGMGGMGGGGGGGGGFSSGGGGDFGGGGASGDW